MKRAEALRSLSRDHHKALMAAIQLRKATDTEPASKAFLDFWRDHGRHHFRIEEEVLLPCWAVQGEVDAEAAHRMLDEHLLIRREVLRLEGSGLEIWDLARLGQLLDDHVRFEERELFPLIERQLTDEALSELAIAMERAEAAGPASYT